MPSVSRHFDSKVSHGEAKVFTIEFDAKQLLLATRLFAVYSWFTPHESAPSPLTRDAFGAGQGPHVPEGRLQAVRSKEACLAFAMLFPIGLGIFVHSLRSGPPQDALPAPHTHLPARGAQRYVVVGRGEILHETKGDP